MKREFRLLDKDMLSEQHFPIKAVFDMVSDDRFIRILEGISEGRGFGENYGACVFPDDLDEYDLATSGTLEGVEFGLHNGEEIIVDYETLLYYLNIVCDGYIQDYPDDKAVTERFLERYKKKLI